MGKFLGANIVESRDYDNPSNPEESTYHVRLPVTVPEAVLDTTTGKSLRTIITEQSNGISDAKTAAESAQNTAQTAQEAATAAQSAVSTIQTQLTEGGGVPASTLGGKTADDFAPAVHTHTTADITDFPESLPANGGNADTVDGAHVVTTSELGLHRMASGTAAANSTNCPPGCWYGQYE